MLRRFRSPRDGALENWPQPLQAHLLEECLDSQTHARTSVRSPLQLQSLFLPPSPSLHLFSFSPSLPLSLSLSFSLPLRTRTFYPC